MWISHISSILQMVKQRFLKSLFSAVRWQVCHIGRKEKEQNECISWVPVCLWSSESFKTKIRDLYLVIWGQAAVTSAGKSITGESRFFCCWRLPSQEMMVRLYWGLMDGVVGKDGCMALPEWYRRQAQPAGSESKGAKGPDSNGSRCPFNSRR